MYENYKLCPDLRPKECCIVLEQYKSGIFERAYHRHIPRHRISGQSMAEMLRAFVVRFDGFSGLGADTIVTSYLNGRGTSPTATDPFQMTVTYPEPGVLRHYCGTNTKAWLDEVIVPSKFRQESAKH